MKNIGSAKLTIGALIFLVSFHLFALTSDDERIIKNLISDGKIKTAIELIDSIEKSALMPDPTLSFIKGLAYARNKEDTKAIETFEDIIKNYPKYPEAYNNLAVLYANKGELDKAIRILESAIKTNKSYSTAYLNLGDLYSKKAANVYAEVLKIDNANNIAVNKLRLIEKFFNYNPVAMEAEFVMNKTNEEPKTTTKDIGKSLAIKAINQWKTGWENKDYAQYFGAYSPLFEYPAKMKKKEWQQYRKERIKYKKTIKIELIDLVVFKKKDLFHATFTQEYQSDNFLEKSTKMLVLSFDGDQWKIIKEISY